MSEHHDILVFGSLNMDFVSFTPRLPEKGETIAANDFAMVPGGKGANQAVASARLGANVAMVGCIGEDYLGQQMLEGLTEEGVHVDGVIKSNDHKTGVATVTVDDHGNNTITTFKGANEALTKRDVDSAEDMIKTAQIIVLQLEMDLEVAEYVITKANQFNKKIVLNLAPVVPLQQDTLSKVDVLIINETEASQLSNTKVDSIEEAKESACTIQQDIGIEKVVITLGDKGVVLYNEGILHFYDTPDVEVVDSTAAGDCFTASLATFWIKEEDLESAVLQSAKVAALSVTKKGAQTSLPTLQEYYEYFRKEEALE